MSKSFIKTISIGFLAMGLCGTAHGAGVSQSSSDSCNARLRSQARRFSAQIRRNLTALKGFPVWAVEMDSRATGMIATVLNIKPDEVAHLAEHPMKIDLVTDPTRLQLELQDWPRFHRTQVSLRQPQVAQDMALAHEVLAPDADSLNLVLESTTNLFYVVKDLPHDMQIGFSLPTRDVMDTSYAMPFYEFDLSLLKACPGGSESEHTQVFQDENGESYCIDTLVRFSTWPEDPGKQ